MPIDLVKEKIRYCLGQSNDIKAAKKHISNAIKSKKVLDDLETFINYASFTDLNAVDEIYEVFKEHTHNFIPTYINYYKSLFEKRIFSREDSIKHLDKAYSMGLPIQTFLTDKSYLLLVEEKYDEVLALNETYKDHIGKIPCEVFTINVQFADKKIKSPVFHDVTLRNINAKSDSTGIKICTFILLDNIKEARRLIKDRLQIDFIDYYYFSKWPIIPESILEDFSIENTTLS